MRRERRGRRERGEGRSIVGVVGVVVGWWESQFVLGFWFGSFPGSRVWADDAVAVSRWWNPVGGCPVDDGRLLLSNQPFGHGRGRWTLPRRWERGGREFCRIPCKADLPLRPHTFRSDTGRSRWSRPRITTSRAPFHGNAPIGVRHGWTRCFLGTALYLLEMF